MTPLLLGQKLQFPFQLPTLRRRSQERASLSLNYSGGAHDEPHGLALRLQIKVWNFMRLSKPVTSNFWVFDDKSSLAST
jgi:hypothetical protein